jgi:hypothetical protein
MFAHFHHAAPSPCGSRPFAPRGRPSLSTNRADENGLPHQGLSGCSRALLKSARSFFNSSRHASPAGVSWYSHRGAAADQRDDIAPRVPLARQHGENHPPTNGLTRQLAVAPAPELRPSLFVPRLRLAQGNALALALGVPTGRYTLPAPSPPLRGRGSRETVRRYCRQARQGSKHGLTG